MFRQWHQKNNRRDENAVRKKFIQSAHNAVQRLNFALGKCRLPKLEAQQITYHRGFLKMNLTTDDNNEIDMSSSNRTIVGLKRSQKAVVSEVPRSNRTIVGLKQFLTVVEFLRAVQQSHHCGIETLAMALLWG